MIRNYLKIAWRNLFRNKGFSLTNILGLATGITCTLFIFLWVKDELTFDRFHKKYHNIYQVMANRDFNNSIMTDQNMVLPLASSLEKKYPQIENAVTTSHPESHIFSFGDNKIKKTGLTVSDNFFKMFTWKFLKGSAASAISDPSSIVLSESTAKAFFGKEDPLNKILKLDNDQDFKVSAVVEDPPSNSTLQFDFVKAFNFSDPFIRNSMNEWVNSSWNVYIEMPTGTDIAAIEKKINLLKKEHDPNDKMSTYFTFPMEKWRLYSDFREGKNVGGMIEYVRLFTIIAIIILLIACVNFMNLSTARSEKRAREVGVRKTLGSGKRALVFQFFIESVILSFIAFVIAVITVYLLLPAFNTMVNKHLVLDFSRPVMWLGAFAIIFFTGIVAGSYPALYLSSFNAAKVLKGSFLPGKKAVLPRRILVVGQFVISILLISATLIVYQQILHVKNRDIGYNSNNLIMVPATPDVNSNYTIIKEELLKTGAVNAVCRTFSPITEVWWKSPAPEWKGKPADANIIVTGFSTDVDFAKTIGVKMLQGEDFSGLPSDSSSLLLNKAAVDVMGLKDPVGTQMRYLDKNFVVAGVTSNVVMESPFKPVEPMIIFFQPERSNVLNLRLNTAVPVKQAVNEVQAVLKKYNPSVPFEYQFADQEFNKKFLTEELISKITNIFAGLAIFISCIGLAGLASFTIEKRIREIGIRKVLGASIQQILLLISVEFLKLVFVAFLIAVPLTWWAMSNWLEKYEYHIKINFALFVAVGLMVLLLTVVVVSMNTLKAAMSNPVKSLRSE